MAIQLLNIFAVVSFFFLLAFLSKKQISLSVRILISMALGAGYSFLLKYIPHDFVFDALHQFLYFIGNAYLALLKMLVIPLILTSLIHAILHLGSNDNNVKRMTIMSVGMLLGLTSLSSLIAILIGKWFQVGEGLVLPDFLQTPTHVYKGLADTLLQMLPSNPAGVMVKENTIAVVIFAVFLGIAARTLDIVDHDKMNTFKQFIASLFAIIKRLAQLILRLTPYGIFSLISLLLFDQGLTVLLSMFRFIVAMYTAMALVMMMHVMILTFFKINPLTYFKKAINALFVAFTTRSSFGTLPVTEETLREQFKTNQLVATFVPSMGATLGMNACAGVFPAMLVVMTLTILHQPLTLNIVLFVMMINAVASLGISGIPGTAYIAATVTLTSLNLPYGIVGLVQGIDPIIDMGRTAVNVNGVMTTALVVNKFTQREHDQQNLSSTE
jgi:L-cystine uptake protein TcyP (sodium:dicarboxylate symporter family)